MKRFGWMLVLLLAMPTLPAWSAGPKKITVQQLKDLLAAAQAANKNDDDVSLQLKQVELSEELTFATMNSLSNLVPGKLSTEQMYVLEARSATLPPPASDLPTAAAPDAAAQQAMLAKAADYASKTYPQLPHLAATKMTARFQDGVEAIPTNVGMHVKVNPNDDPLWEEKTLYIRLKALTQDPAESDNGIEKIVATKEKPQWGPNGLVTSVIPTIPLNELMQQVAANGNPKFLRWETIDNKQIAVFSFAVDKKKTHYGINYCCFPDTDTAGTVNFSKSQSATAGGGSAAKGNLQTVSDWKNFKTNLGYHGELFVDPDSGTIVRTITRADLKPSDFVHYENIRTDYAPVTIGGKTLVVPIRSFTISEIVPNGDSFAAHYSVRHDLVTEDYKDYQLAGATAQK